MGHGDARTVGCARLRAHRRSAAPPPSACGINNHARSLESLEALEEKDRKKRKRVEEKLQVVKDDDANLYVLCKKKKKKKTQTGLSRHSEAPLAPLFALLCFNGAAPGSALVTSEGSEDEPPSSPHSVPLNPIQTVSKTGNYNLTFVGDISRTQMLGWLMRLISRSGNNFS